MALLGLLLGTASLVRGRSISLAEAQRIALAQNPDLRSAAANVHAALGEVRAAREFPNPMLSFSTAGINTDGRGNGSPLHNELLQRSYDSIVSLSQFLELAGKRGLRQDSVRANRQAAESQLADARRLLLQSVTQAYVAAAEAREEVRVLNDSAASLQREADVAATRLKVGDISSTDKAQIEIAAERFALAAAAARQTATVATITLETLLGIAAPSGETELADALPQLVTTGGDNLPDASIVGTRPDIAAAESSLSKADADYRLQQRERIPDVTVSAQFEHHPPDEPNSAGLGLSLPLPIWNRNHGAIEQARAARELAAAQLDKVRTQAAADVATARLAYVEARQRAESYHHGLLAKSADVVRTITYAYEKGGASLLDLLSAQRNDNDLRLAAAQADAQLAEAGSALAAALNRLNPPSNP